MQQTFTLNVSSQSPFDWSQAHIIMTTSPWFLQQSTGFQCTRALCSRLWCWCGSVLTALLPATSPNFAFLLPLLQVVSISGQPRRAYYKFPECKPRSAGVASLFWCAGFTASKQNEHSPPPGAVVAFLRFWHRTQNCRLTYLLAYSPIICIMHPICLFCLPTVMVKLLIITNS